MSLQYYNSHYQTHYLDSLPVNGCCSIVAVLDSQPVTISCQYQIRSVSITLTVNGCYGIVAVRIILAAYQTGSESNIATTATTATDGGSN